MMVVDVTLRPCGQKQCSYNVRGGCKSCSDCGSEPNVIAVSCSVCLACENLPDMLRWDDERLEKERALKVFVPEVVEQPREEKLIVIGGINNGK